MFFKFVPVFWRITKEFSKYLQFYYLHKQFSDSSLNFYSFEEFFKNSLKKSFYYSPSYSFEQFLVNFSLKKSLRIFSLDLDFAKLTRIQTPYGERTVLCQILHKQKRMPRYLEIKGPHFKIKVSSFPEE